MNMNVRSCKYRIIIIVTEINNAILNLKIGKRIVWENFMFGFYLFTEQTLLVLCNLMFF